MVLAHMVSLVWWIVCVAGAGTASAGPLVEIAGGPDATSHHYEWTIRNLYTSPIVYVSFPHYRADLFFVPEGWTTDGTTHLKQLGETRFHGVCVGQIKRSSRGIAPGESARFRMRVDGAQARPEARTVLVRFADGSQTSIPDVVVPQAEATSDKLVPLVGLGGIFMFLILAALRRRRQSSDNVEASAAAPNR